MKRKVQKVGCGNCIFHIFDCCGNIESFRWGQATRQTTYCNGHAHCRVTPNQVYEQVKDSETFKNLSMDAQGELCVQQAKARRRAHLPVKK